jgi:hypothetical protein
MGEKITGHTGETRIRRELYADALGSNLPAQGESVSSSSAINTWKGLPRKHGLRLGTTKKVPS